MSLLAISFDPTTLVAATTNLPELQPNNTFFGAGLATTWMQGIAYIALVLVVIGLVLSAGLWAVGAFSNNYTQSVNGKKGFLICAAAALAIGAAQKGVDYFFNAGNNLSSGA